MKLVSNAGESRSRTLAGLIFQTAGTGIIFFFFCLLLISTVFFFLNIRIGPVIFILSSLFTTVFIFVLSRGFSGNKRFVVPVAIILSLAGLLFVSAKVMDRVYDVSYDGSQYQQEGVIQIATGWNPVRQPKPENFELHDANADEIGYFLKIYTKAHWIWGGAFYAITGRIESCKAVNIFWALAAFLLALSALLKFRRMGTLTAILISLLTAFNPITICQIFTFYVDTQVASILVCMTAASIMLFRRQPRFWLFILFMLLIMGLNLKIPVLAYDAVLGAGLLAALLVARKFITARNLVVMGILAGVIGFFGTGYSPYVVNLKETGNSFYPFWGKDKTGQAQDLFSTQKPLNFQGINRFKKLALSLFSVTRNAYAPEGSVLKIPLTINKNEILAGLNADTRVGGFGPLFGGILLLSGLLFVFLVIRAFRQKDFMIVAVCLFILAVILAQVLLNPEGWWARYAPQMYLWPLTIVGCAFLTGGRALKISGAVLLALLITNSVLTVVGCPIQQIAHSDRLKKQFDVMSRSGKTYSLSYVNFTPSRIRLREKNIRYIPVSTPEDLDCSPKGRFSLDSITVCGQEH